MLFLQYDAVTRNELGRIQLRLEDSDNTTTQSSKELATKYQNVYFVFWRSWVQIYLRNGYDVFHGKFRQQAYLKLDHNFSICLLTVQPLENKEDICGGQSGTGAEIFVLSTPAFPCQGVGTENFVLSTPAFPCQGAGTEIFVLSTPAFHCQGAGTEIFVLSTPAFPCQGAGTEIFVLSTPAFPCQNENPPT